METGRHICNELKALRRGIAEGNGIPLETEECTYRGECCGTCPRCDAEVRYLEDALSRRLRMGKAAVVAGVALGLAVGSGVQAQNVTDTIPLKPLATEIPDTVGKVRVTGVVKNAKTKESEPFVNVVANKDGEMIAGAATDFEGRYSFYLPVGEYDIEISAIGFKNQVLPRVFIDGTKNIVELEDVILENNIITITKGVIVKDPEKIPSLNFEYESVKVIAK